MRKRNDKNVVPCTAEQNMGWKSRVALIVKRYEKVQVRVERREGTYLDTYSHTMHTTYPARRRWDVVVTHEVL